MPDDNLFPDEQHTPEGEGESTQPAPTLADLSQQIAQLTEAQQQGSQNPDVMEALSVLAQDVQDLKVRSNGAGETPQPPETPDDRITRLVEDPDTYIKEASVKAIQERLGPYLRQQAEQTRDNLVSEQRDRIEKEFGAGTWDEVFAEPMEQTLGRMPLEMQTSRQHVEAAVAAIYGRKHLSAEDRQTLDERRSARAKEAEAQNSPPPMLDGSRPRPPRGDTLTQTERDFVASLVRSGVPYTEEQYIRARERGGRASSWKRESQR